jgi:hypothetical protein
MSATANRNDAGAELSAVVRQRSDAAAAATAVAESPNRFADGVRYRIEIASVEGPQVLRGVIEESVEQGVHVQRVSQGSGVMMLTDAEISEMVELGVEHGIEVALFLGPRAEWEIGGQAMVTETSAGTIRGAQGLTWALAEAKRACDLGIRGLLIADLGALVWLAERRAAGDLPPDLRFKTSVMMPCQNPASARTLESLGANTLNIPPDLSIEQVSDLRAATTLPLDLYVESPDDLGGFVRYYEVPALIRVGSPMYVKLGLRNAANVYPSGGHLVGVAEAQAREKVRRAALVERLIIERAPELREDPGVKHPQDLAVPESTGQSA